MFPYSLFYVYFDQYFTIRGIAAQAILLSCGCVYLVLLLVKNVQTALIVFLCVFSITMDLIGCSYLLNNMISGTYLTLGWEIQFNAVSVVNIITAIGLSVEFCVHVMMFFLKARGDRDAKVTSSLTTIGSSVLTGIIFTKFLGVVVLAFASSTLFRLYYFRMYILIVFIGFFHGMMFLPVLLSYIGPVNPRKSSSFA
jgi:Niemann-Pick C1 protein